MKDRKSTRQGKKEPQGIRFSAFNSNTDGEQSCRFCPKSDELQSRTVSHIKDTRRING